MLPEIPLLRHRTPTLSTVKDEKGLRITAAEFPGQIVMSLTVIGVIYAGSS